MRVTAVSSCPKSCQPFDEPERCHDADPIGRDGPQPTFDDVGNSKLLGQLHHAENGGDESKLSHLDADVEGEQRERECRLVEDRYRSARWRNRGRAEGRMKKRPPRARWRSSWAPPAAAAGSRSPEAGC